jgi:IstB-like ATP binding protein
MASRSKAHRSMSASCVISLKAIFSPSSATVSWSAGAEYLTRRDFVVFDELGHLPFAQTGGQLLFHLISQLYERTQSSSRPISLLANGRAFS